MSLHNLLNAQSVCVDHYSQSKTAAFFKITQILCANATALDMQNVFDAFWQRETLGSTAIGRGILLPHIRIESIKRTHAACIRLMHPIDFGAEDKQPVDLIFAMLVPTTNPQQHLQNLAAIVKYFSNPSFCNQLRQAGSDTELYAAFMGNSVELITS